MTAYVACSSTVVQNFPAAQEGVPIGGNLPPGSQDITLKGSGYLVLSSTPGMQLIVTGSSPGVLVSATVQPLCSNDGIHWSTFGSTITVASVGSPGLGTGTATGNYEHYSGIVTAISGTGAKATLLINV